MSSSHSHLIHSIWKFSDCRLTNHLGSGQFGTVSGGLWQSAAGVKEVAVKTLQAGASESDNVKFLQEAAINGQFQHPNIVRLLGVVTIGSPVCCIHNYCVDGTWVIITVCMYVCIVPTR